MKKLKEDKRYILSIIILITVVLVTTIVPGRSINVPFDAEDVEYIELNMGWPATDVIVIEDEEKIESVVYGLKHNFDNHGFKAKIYFENFFMASGWPYSPVFKFYLADSSIFVLEFDTVHSEKKEMYSNVRKCYLVNSDSTDIKSNHFFAKGTFQRDMYILLEDEILEVYPTYPNRYL